MNKYEDIYEVVKLIPIGKVTSYGAIARYLGASPRLVGWALNSSHSETQIPAHRVVNRNGLLTGKMHFKTPTLMQELLESEGVIIRNDQIQNFEQHFWDPEIQLRL